MIRRIVNRRQRTHPPELLHRHPQPLRELPDNAAPAFGQLTSTTPSTPFRVRSLTGRRRDVILSGIAQTRQRRDRTADPAVARPTTIDEYLVAVKGDNRAALEKLRKTIRSIVPKAEECISYRIPAFRLGGTVVAGFCATAKGCSYFPFSGSTLRTLARDLEGYDKTKSSLHFSPKVPLPATLVRKLIKARIAEIER